MEKYGEIIIGKEFLVKNSNWFSFSNIRNSNSDATNF